MFEDKILCVEAGEDVPGVISLVQPQKVDQETSNAFRELKSKGEVTSGQLRKVSDMFKLSPRGTLLPVAFLGGS